MPLDPASAEDIQYENELMERITTRWSEYIHMHPRRLAPDARLRVIEQMERDVKLLADSERLGKSLRFRTEQGEALVLEDVA
ncbi:MAG: hypothetical protein ACTIDN_09750 [Acetobacter sp.]|uniref:hypothetical protein n=1 Tax=Acetobacter sp. TaxID=440 RepID=UPI003F90C1DD